MAKVGDIEAASSHSEHGSGAAFLLHRVSPVSATISVNLDSTVEVSARNPFVVARTKGYSGAEEAYTAGHELVQQGLDYLSIKGKADLATRDTSDERIVWWRNDGKQILRYVDTISSKWEISVKITVGDGSSAKPAKPELPTYHKAFRYFRLSQVTDDLFNAYRNMYLAFELLLSSHNSKGKEREIAWLERALGTLDLNILPKVFRSNPDPVQATIDAIYKDARLPLFHAKDGRDFYEPYGSPGERDAVASALESLTELVLNLSKAITGTIRSMGGRMNSALRNSIWTSILSDAYFIVLDDDSPYDRSATDLSHPRYEKAVSMKTSISSDLVRHDYPVLIGRLRKTDFGALQVAKRIETINDTSPLADSLLPIPLHLDGLDILECQLNMRQQNARAPKRFFSS